MGLRTFTCWIDEGEEAEYEEYYREEAAKSHVSALHAQGELDSDDSGDIEVYVREEGSREVYKYCGDWTLTLSVEFDDGTLDHEEDPDEKDEDEEEKEDEEETPTVTTAQSHVPPDGSAGQLQSMLSGRTPTQSSAGWTCGTCLNKHNTKDRCGICGAKMP